MAATELRDDADGRATEPAGPDVLALAPTPVSPRLVRAVLVAVLVLLLAVGGYLGWRSRQPPPDFTLAQLEGAYAGMVRSDGTNDVSTITAANFGEQPLQVTPEACTPLFATTVSNQFPAGALDGVSTYWLDGTSSVSLFTVRYADAGDAEQAYGEVAAAAQACEGRTVTISEDQGTGVLRTVPVAPSADAPDQVGYLLDRPADEGRYALHLLRLTNSLTWQYRYEAPDRVLPIGSSPAVQAYDPLPAQQLVDGLATQLLSIQAADAGR
jgi:hypothetical protein